MILIKAYDITHSMINFTFLTNDVTMTANLPISATAGLSNNEIIDEAYKQIKPSIVDYCKVNNMEEDTEINYIVIDFAEGAQKNGLTMSEIEAINADRIRVQELVRKQKMERELITMQTEMNALKSLLSDMASLQLEV